MNDLISRQAAIEALGEEPEVWSGEDEYEQGLNNQWHYDITAIKAVPSAGQWVPVTERIPDKTGVYLVTILNREWVGKEIVQGAKPPKDDLWKNHANIYAERTDGKWVMVAQRVFQNDVRPIWSGYGEQVLAWMPLPEPWKGEE